VARKQNGEPASDEHASERSMPQRTSCQRAVNADVVLVYNETPVAETVDNVRKHARCWRDNESDTAASPRGISGDMAVKDDVETGEALGARRRNLVEEDAGYNRGVETQA